MAKSLMNKYGDIVLIKADQRNREYYQPDPAAPESERTPEYYVDNVKWACSFYNTWYNSTLVGNSGLVSMGVNGSAANVAASNTNLPAETPIQHMIRMMSYYNGWQPNLDYNHLNKDITTTNLMPSWIRSQKVFSVVNVKKDVMDQMIANVDFDAENLSEEAMTAKARLLAKLQIQMEMQDMIGNLSQQGVTINSAGGKQFDMEEQIKEYVDNLKDKEIEMLVKIARNIWLSNQCDKNMLHAYVHSQLAGRCGIEHSVVNGQYKMDLRMPYELIVDNRVDDDYNSKAVFVGTVKWYSPQQAFAIQPALLKYKDEFLKMAQDSNFGSPYNTMNNLAWWNYGSQQRGTCAAVRLYWKTLRPTNKKEFKGKYGNSLIRNTNENERGDYLVEDICTAEIWGNRYMTDYGYMSNIVENFYEKSKVELPIKVFMPDMNQGFSVSLVSRISALVDEYDAIRTVTREMIGHAKGKVYMIKAWKFGNAANQRDMEHDFRTLGFHVQTHSGEADDYRDDEGNILEMLDMTLDPNVLRLQEILNTINMEILEVAKISQSSLGNDQTMKYMGLGVSQQAIQGGSGNSSGYTSYINWVQSNIAYGAEICRYLYTEATTADEQERAVQVIGTKGMDMLKISRKLRYCNPLLYLVVSPFIDKDQRQRLLLAADRFIQNDQMNPLDYVAVETARTMPELRESLKYGLKQKDQQKEHEAALTQMLQQLQQQNQAMAQQLQAIQQQGIAAASQQAQMQGKMQQQQLDQSHERGMEAMQQVGQLAQQQQQSSALPAQ